MKRLFVGAMRTILAIIVAAVFSTVFTWVIVATVDAISVKAAIGTLSSIVIFFVAYTSYLTWADMHSIKRQLREQGQLKNDCFDPPRLTRRKRTVVQGGNVIQEEVEGDF